MDSEGNVRKWQRRRFQRRTAPSSNKLRPTPRHHDCTAGSRRQSRHSSISVASFVALWVGSPSPETTGALSSRPAAATIARGPSRMARFSRWVGENAADPEAGRKNPGGSDPPVPGIEPGSARCAPAGRTVIGGRGTLSLWGPPQPHASCRGRAGEGDRDCLTITPHIDNIGATSINIRKIDATLRFLTQALSGECPNHRA